MPPQPGTRRRARFSGRGRTALLVAVIALIALALSLKGIATFYTDFLWFRSLGLTDVWRNVLGARVVLALVFVGLFFALCWLNLYVADRTAPAFRPPGPEEDMLEPYHAFVERRRAVTRLAVALLFAVIAGAGASGRWNDWILFTNRVDFGVKDPQFGHDIAFYVFQLPFLSFLVNWLFFSFVTIFVITTVAHYLNGGIRLQTPGERVTPQVKAHLSLLLGVLALIKAADYWVQRFELTTSTRGVVDGAAYTDVRVQLPAIHLLALISLLSFVLLLINIRRRGWQLPAVTVGLWLFVSISVGTVYPAIVQRFSVEPAESTKERPYVDRNIEGTRRAYGLDRIEAEPYEYVTELTADEVRADIDNLIDARIVDPAAVRGAFQREQAKRTYYRFPDRLDVDRYVVDGKLTQVIIGARELNPGEQNGWENAHVAYTHGNGIVLAPANTVSERGLPQYLIGEVPPSISPKLGVDIELPQIYFGENLGGYAIVNASGRAEVDYTDEGEREVLYRYEGAGGVRMGSIIRRAAFALRFGQVEPLISNFVSPDSRVIFNRDITTRVKTIAPFLKWDSDPYPVVFDGRVVYVIDGYTTSSRYPYAQRAEGGSGVLSGGGFNYVRNSVKAVVDAYDGSVSFYVMPVDDPIIRAYAKAFPNLFSTYDEMPDGLKNHLRYPQDLFSLQTTMWARYHIGDPAAFLSRSGQWSVAQDAPRVVERVGDTVAAVAFGRRGEDRVAPYYQQIRLPGESEPSFVSLRTFVPYNPDDTLRQLTAFMVADSSGDPERYGRLKVYEFTNQLAPGPAAVAGNINAKREIAERISLLNQQGSTVEYGDMLLLPIRSSVVYVRPLYVTSRDATFPALQGVVASVGERVELGGSLQEALERLFGVSFAAEFGGPPPPAPTPPTSPPPPAPPGTGTVDEQLRALLRDVLRKQDEADAALRSSPPDLQAYGRLQSEIRALLERAAVLAGAKSDADVAGVTSAPPGTTTTTTTIRPATA
jgi:uncharacterized protein